MSNEDSAKSVLVVDDEREIRRAMELVLRPRGYEVISVEKGEEALAAMSERTPDLVILDLALPGISGLEVCRRIRSWSQVPIIVLSVRSSERDKIAALDLGADDYVTKPFAMGELLARMRAALRRSQTAQKVEPSIFESRGLTLNVPVHQVLVNGQEVKLTPKEFDILKYLMSHSDCIVTHTQLLTTVWGDAFRDDRPLLRVHIANLRQKIEPQPARPTYILNEPGVGYRFSSG
jgi:two-component system KDP operon response regulator KdpE